MKQGLSYSEHAPLLDCFITLVQEARGDQVCCMVLYGSVSRGEPSPETDVDLLLILKEASPVYWERLQPLIPLVRRFRGESIWNELEARGLSPSLSALVLSREEAEQNRLLDLDMIDWARILLDQDGFYQDRLDALKVRLRELGARKVRRDGAWFWDLKRH